MTAYHSRSLLDLAPPDLRAHLEHDDTILIPLGSCEMHGDHMPLGTDIYNAIEVCRRAAEKADTLYASADLERLQPAAPPRARARHGNDHHAQRHARAAASTTRPGR